MKKLKRLLMLLLVFTSLLGPSGALATPQLPVATEPVSLSQILDACDAALNAKKAEAELCSQGKDLRDKEIARLGGALTEAQASESSLFKNPFVWAAVGVIFGAWAGARATR